MARSANYRADIDGLRAIAVALVIVYHFLPLAAPAGFVGVDAFFVISGFVVTRSIVHAETGRWTSDLIGFWRRRFLRIFPPLALMLGVVAVLGQIFLPPFPLVSSNANARTAVAALFGLSNLYLDRIGLDYFASSDTNLYLHTWSLGVEEQFYVAFALVFIVLLPALKAARLRFAAVAVLAAVSLALCVHAAQARPGAAYYFLQYRFWELAIGSMLAMARLPSLPRASGWAALAALALSAYLPFGSGYPLANILIATGASALLIWSGERHPLGVLGSRPMVHIGLISYPLYLWHWPFAVLAKFTLGTGWLGTGTALAATVLAATASYRLVELRWRGRGSMITAGAFVAAFGGLAAAMAAGATLRPGLLYAGAPQDWQGEWRRGESYAYGGTVTVQCMLSDGAGVPEAIPASCTAPAGPGQRRVIIVGDSQAEASWGMFDAPVRAGALGMASLVHSGCGLQDPGKPLAASCRAYWQAVPGYVRQQARAGDVVFLATAWNTASGIDPMAQARLDALQQAAKAAGASVMVQTALPAFKRPGFLCTQEWFRRAYDGCAEPLATYRARKAGLNAALAARGLGVWDPEPLLCSGGICPSIAAGKPLFRDYIHLSAHGSRMLGPGFLAAAGLAPPAPAAGAAQ